MARSMNGSMNNNINKRNQQKFPSYKYDSETTLGKDEINSSNQRGFNKSVAKLIKFIEFNRIKEKSQRNTKTTGLENKIQKLSKTIHQEIAKESMS